MADPAAVGNGFHVHFSVHREGQNVFSGGSGRYGMTETGEHLIAGVIAGLHDATGLFAPSPLSYARLVPGHWAGAYACWGLENREAALRFIQGTVTGRGDPLIDTFTAVRRYELNTYATKPLDEIVPLMRWVY